jgi:hypothetical protein
MTESCAWKATGIALFLGLTLLAGRVQAQIGLEQGEPVRVLYLGSWHDGVVASKGKNQEWQVEIEFAGSPTQKSIPRSDIRKMCEVDALDYARTWTSSDGKFKVDAAIKSAESDSVILIKTDMSELTVPLKSLSAADQSYVNNLNSARAKAVASGAAPAVIATLPEIEQFDTSTGFGYGSLGKAKPGPLGSMPNFLAEFNQAGVGFNLTRDGQEVVAVIPVGGPDQLVLLTAREDDFFSRENPFQSQAYWVSLKQKKVLGSVAISPEDYPVDYDPRHKLLLTLNQNDFGDDDDDPDYYAIWKLPVGGTKAEPIVRWQAPILDSFDSLFAKIVNERIVVSKTARNTYDAWDFVAKKGAYSFISSSFFDAPVVISLDRKNLIVPEDGQVLVIDAVNGEAKMTLSVEDRHVSGANINSDGTRLAAVTERNIYEWDLRSADPQPTIHPATLIASPFQSRIEWVDNDHVFAESSHDRVLYRLSLELPIWSYQMDAREYWLNRDPLKNFVINGHYFYLAKPDPFSKAIAVGAVKLPGPKVTELTGNVDRESLNIVKPGTAIALDIRKVTDRDQVEMWLMEKFAQHEWELDPDAEIKLVAEMGVAEPQSVTYQDIGSGAKTQVTVSPHYSTLKLMKGSTIIWQSGTSSGAPPFIRNDNAQAQIDAYQQPQLEFFRDVEIDRHIIDPKYSHGFGVSKLGLRGIEVVSTSPPGRPDDPMQADAQAKTDQQRLMDEMRSRFGAGNR